MGNRVVPNFLTQFGIAKDYATRTKERELTIWDDFPKGIKFEPGMLSFAGSGHDSRTTEIVVVMPGVSEEQAAKFGANSWEVPFAVNLVNVRDSLRGNLRGGSSHPSSWT